MTAADDYSAAVETVTAQRHHVLTSIRHTRTTDDADHSDADRAGPTPAASDAPTPQQELDPELSVIASYMEPGDTLLDVGGGSGRLGLSLARSCQQMINVEPSPTARRAFTAAAAARSVKNVRTVAHDWLSAPAQLEGDLVLAAHVTYTVSDIVPFVDRLQSACRRRVMILLYVVPAEGQPIHQRVHELLFGETAEVPPSYQQLLPVLWEMRLLPDVRIIEEVGVRPQVPSIEAAITRTLQSFGTVTGVHEVERAPWARRVLREHADSLYRPVEGGGYRPALAGDDHRGVLITWEHHQVG